VRQAPVPRLRTERPDEREVEIGRVRQKRPREQAETETPPRRRARVESRDERRARQTVCDGERHYEAGL